MIKILELIPWWEWVSISFIFVLSTNDHAFIIKPMVGVGFCFFQNFPNQIEYMRYFLNLVPVVLWLSLCE